ncbi:ABC transporter substrate-binding protein [Ferruginibacter sp. SUN106]|uniref:ABC transporter substrate-binding protein n=1 Tax=Ferruginibacter sp. SUN106 TaxID=2978348 RepID=UPI003D35D76C
MKAGILFPLSTAHPGIGADFMDGLQTFLKQQGVSDSISFIKEGVAFGGVEKEVYQKAEKLLISDEVDILIAYVDEKVLPVLYPLIQATGKLMLVINPGANYPVNWITQPNVIHLNLQHAFLCWLTGALAAASTNGHAVLATSYYDCGYLHTAAMVKNFMEQGGTIRHNYINNQAYDDGFEIKQLTDFLSVNANCKNLLCVFDEKPASLFFSSLDQYAAASALHLFVSPMMLSSKLLNSTIKKSSCTITGYLPWYTDMENETSLLFVKSCTRPATIFSLLGWETGMILETIWQQGTVTNVDAVVDHLKTKTISSPRGILKLDSETQFYIAPVAKYSLKAGADAAQIEWIHNVDNEWKAFTTMPTEGAVTGWTNTYLCY